jgi:hypothetical protein
LTADGTGVFDTNGAQISEIRLKAGGSAGAPGIVIFPRLVMTGGEIDMADDGGQILMGEMDVNASTPIYNDSVASTDRYLEINSFLTGNGAIQYWGYLPSAGVTQFELTYTNDLNITGTSNTYSGSWEVVWGILMGSAPNSLGQANITVDDNGALETTYDIASPRATLTVTTYGQVFLHQNDTLGTVVIAGTPLAPGTYAAADLINDYPNNFLASWPSPHHGSGIATASGTITVTGLTQAPAPVPITLQNQQLSWPSGWNLLQATNVSGPWILNSAISPYAMPLTGPQMFYRLQSQ